MCLGLLVQEASVGGQAGTLGQLGRQGVDKLRHATRVRVIRLTEVVTHHLVCQLLRQPTLLPGVLSTWRGPKAAFLNQ